MYYGVVALDPGKFQYPSESSSTAGAGPGAEAAILPAVLSIGYNPFYKNKTKSIVRFPLPPTSLPMHSLFVMDESVC